MPASGLRTQAKSATHESGAFVSCAGHWPPQIILADGIFHRAELRLSRPVTPISGAASLADALAGRLLYLWAGLTSPSAYTSLALFY